jgi:stalled ribosome rescue protein Dom34
MTSTTRAQERLTQLRSIARARFVHAVDPTTAEVKLPNHSPRPPSAMPEPTRAHCFAVWIDHKEAHVFHIEPNQVDGVIVKAPPRHIHHRHQDGRKPGKQQPEDNNRFFAEISRSLEGTDRILIVGPASAKLEFLRYLQLHAHSLELRVAGIETVDHPSDGQLVAYAKKYFDKTP